MDNALTHYHNSTVHDALFWLNSSMDPLVFHVGHQQSWISGVRITSRSMIAESGTSLEYAASIVIDTVGVGASIIVAN